MKTQRAIRRTVAIVIACALFFGGLWELEYLEGGSKSVLVLTCLIAPLFPLLFVHHVESMAKADEAREYAAAQRTRTPQESGSA